MKHPTRTWFACCVVVAAWSAAVSLASPAPKPPKWPEVGRIQFPKQGNFQAMAWAEAFDALHKKMSAEYAFTDWRRIDWPALYAKARPKIAEAERANDFDAYYVALREYVFSIPDGHVGLGGDDHGLRQKAIGGGYGFAVARLDNGRVVAHVIVENGPAARSGMKAGAEVMLFGGMPIGEAATKVSTLWTPGPTSTAEHRRDAQYRFLTRAPVGTTSDVTFRNPGERELRTVSLTAEADGQETLRRTFYRKPFQRDRLVSHRVLPNGLGYLEVNGEMDKVVEQTKAALEDLIAQDVPGLILDIRNNVGGEDSMAAEISSFFHTRKSLYERVLYYNAATSRFEILRTETLSVKPRQPYFGRPVVCLIGNGTGSSGEGIAWQMNRLPNARTMGFTGTEGIFGMSGGMVRMPGGLTVGYPAGASVDAKGRVQIDSDYTGRGGIHPHVRVPKTYSNMMAFGAGRDVEMEEAIALLQKLIAERSSDYGEGLSLPSAEK